MQESDSDVQVDPRLQLLLGVLNTLNILFGDAVNTASRMESTSSPNKCQVTEETANLIRGYSEGSEMILVSRGKREVKGKGEMETFFVEKKE